MSGSRLRSRGRQRLRREVYAAVAGLPASYVLEAIARRLKIKNGHFEVRFRDGFMQDLAFTLELDIDELANTPVVWGNTSTPPALEEKGTSN
jgi:hypothetical protein